MKKLVLLILITTCYINLLAQTTISGFVKEYGSNELLVGVNIYVKELNIGSTTNKYGYFSFELPRLDKDSLVINFSIIGYENTVKKIAINQNDIVLDIKVKSIITQLKDIIVYSNQKISTNAPLSYLKITSSEIQNTPSFLGEKDILKIIKLTPGVQKGTDGSSFLHVRGGAPDQNLILLDDAVVYNAFHLAGFFSTINSDAIRNLEFLKGGFPAKYGGRLSSVVDILLREGNREQFEMTGGIGLIASRLTLEGPLTKDKNASYIISGKRSYFDLLYAPFAPDDRKDLYHLYDLSAKFNVDVSNKDKLFFSTYTGGDKYSFESIERFSERDMRLRWRNYTTTLRWAHLVNSKIFLNTSFIFSDYLLKQDDFRISKNDTGTITSEEDIDYSSSARNFSLKSGLNAAISPNNTLSGGIIVSKHIFQPENIVINNTLFSEINKNDVDEINAYETSIYIENKGLLFRQLQYTAGLRLNGFWTEGTNYLFLEPRIALSKQFTNNLSAKVGYAHTSQFVSLLSNDGLGFPLDIWVPATEQIQAQLARQISLGLFKDIDKSGLQISLEGYYKFLPQINRLKEGEIVFSGNTIDLQRLNFLGRRTWEDKLTLGKGWSYGGELLIKKPRGKLSGWLGYTLSWTNHQFEAFNQGKKFSPWYDRRHGFNLVGIYKLNKNITLSAAWQYASGQFLTVYDSKFIGVMHSPWTNLENHVGQTAYQLTTRSNVKTPDFHRFDVSIQFHKSKKWGSRTWEISIINLYNRKNPAFFFPDEVLENNVRQRVIKQITLFPFIPSISYNFKFDKSKS